MKTFLRSLLVGACAGAAAPAQQPPASAPHPPAIQKMLDAPVWYLTYTVRLEANGSDGGPGTHSLRRVTSGRMMLGIRSGGPSLSAIANPALMVLTQPDQIDKLVANYANWIHGPPPEDENLPPAQRMTEAQADAHFARVRLQNLEAHMQFSYDYNGPSHVGGTDRIQESGSGTVLHVGEPAFEIDAVNRKFRLMHSFGFTDGPATVNARTGTRETGIGTVHYNRQVTKTGLFPFEAIGSITPPIGNPAAPFIEGTLPNGGNISYSSVHAIQLGPGPARGVRGTFSIAFTLSPEPPEEVDLWIELPPDYQKWQPTADKDEKTAGDVIPFKVVLEKRGGGTPRSKAARFNFFLKNTSREKGVCLNWPPPAAPGSPNANQPPPFDLQFETDKNPDMIVTLPDGQSMVQTAPPDPLSAQAVVSCFDYGAFSEFEASVELENTVVVYGIVRGTTDQRTVKVPFRKDGSNIAQAFFDEKGLSNLPDSDDSEDDPVGDGYKGDGLTLYEEYRGFMVGNEWTSAEPKKKDVFVLNEIQGRWWVWQGIAAFEQATKLKVHRYVRDNQVDQDAVINFSRTSGPHVVDQHAIRIKSGVAGTGYANTADVGTPGKARGIQIPPDVAHRRGRPFAISTTAHELLHCCNIDHHGRGDKTATWYYQPPGNQMYEALPTPGPSGSNFSGVPITVRLENGSPASTSGCFAPGETSGLFDIGVQRGEHSGNQDCPMRYTIAFAYRSTTQPNEYYLTLGDPSGMVLCSDASGTGVNAPSWSPQSRYGPAAVPTGSGVVPQIKKNRGDCLHQLRVNDKPPAPDER